MDSLTSPNTSPHLQAQEPSTHNEIQDKKTDILETAIPAPNYEDLISLLGSGNHPDIARDVQDFPLDRDGQEPLPSSPEPGYHPPPAHLPLFELSPDDDNLFGEHGGNSSFRSGELESITSATMTHVDGPEVPGLRPQEVIGGIFEPRIPQSAVGIPPQSIFASNDQGFRCQFPGCTAMPFQSQYLLQHVKFHHMDKAKDDPRLRKALAQRPQHPSGRRNRFGSPDPTLYAGNSMAEITPHLTSQAPYSSESGLLSDRIGGPVDVVSDTRPAVATLFHHPSSTTKSSSDILVNLRKESLGQISDCTIDALMTADRRIGPPADSDEPQSRLVTDKKQQMISRGAEDNQVLAHASSQPWQTGERSTGWICSWCGKGPSNPSNLYCDYCDRARDTTTGMANSLDGYEMSDDSYNSDAHSIASVPSMFSGTTLSSHFSDGVEVEGALQQLVSLLAGDTGLGPLLEVAISSLSPAKFERNFAKLLKTYAVDLKSYALDELEKGAVRLVYSQRRHLANSLRRIYNPDTADSLQILQNLRLQSSAKAEQLDKYLQDTYPVRKPADPDDGQSSDDSDMDDPVLPYLRTLERVIEFLIGGTPFQKLEGGLVDFLYPSKSSVARRSYSRKRHRSESISENDNGYIKRRRGSDVLDSSDEFDLRLYGEQESSLPQQSKRLDPLTSPLYGEIVERCSVDPSYTQDPQHYVESSLLPFADSYADSLEVTKEAAKIRTQDSQQGLLNSATLSEGNVSKQSRTLVSDDELNVGMVPDEPINSFGDLQTPRQWHEHVLVSPQGLARLASRMALRYCNNYYRPRLRSGYRRIEWTCECGERIYGDFEDTHSDALDALTIHLQNPGQDITDQHTYQGPVDPNTTTSNHPNQGLYRINNDSQTQQRARLQKPTHIPCTRPPPPEPCTPKFLEVCINTGKWHRSLGEIDITRVSCDRELFALIKQRYDEVRGHRSKLFFLEPAKVEWVQFSLEERHRVGIMLHPMAVPPKGEVDNHHYDYEPCPLEPLPPIPDNVFMHYLNDPGPHRRPTWLRRLPKKMNYSLLNASEELVTGWGLHIIEGPNWVAIWTAAFCVTFVSGVFSTLWSILRNDVSGGFGIGSWLVSALTLGIMAYFSKWSQE
ncbi:hypothetical protein MMC27_008354 [Xylographa pallens]|nr:hypothetical protein [Xylographa pallens]